MVYTNANLSESSAKAKAYAYWVALDDIPNWVVETAVRRWHRGEIKVKIDYSWPTPMMLREACKEVLQIAEGKQIILARLLEANNAPIYSEDYCKTMMGRIQNLFSGIAKKKTA